MVVAIQALEIRWCCHKIGTYIYILYLLTYHRSSVHKFCQYSLRFVFLRNPNPDLSLNIPVRFSLKYNIKKTSINYHCFQNDSKNMHIYIYNALYLASIGKQYSFINIRCTCTHMFLDSMVKLIQTSFSLFKKNIMQYAPISALYHIWY